MINLNSGNAKQNQILLKVLLLAGLLIIAVLFVVLTDDKSKKEIKPKNEIKTKSLVNEEDMIKTKWMGNVSTDLDMANQDLRQTKVQNDLLKSELQEIKESLKSMNEKREEDLEAIAKKEQNNQTSNSGSLFSNFPPPVFSGGPNEQSKFLAPEQKKIIRVDKMPDTLNTVEIKKKDEEQIAEPKKEKKEFLPTGSITKITLLSGFDAPTMSAAKTNPLPILMKITDLSILPNRYKYDMRECFAVGEGYGDLSSERAYIRTNTLSCVTQSGEHIDMDFKAMVSGEDGKVGLRGEVVTKQGALLAKSLIAGFLTGIGEAFNKSQQYTIAGGTGTTTGVSDMGAAESLKYGMFGGASKAAEKLADFYLKMADQTAPVIEISAGRKVELITTALTTFEIVENKNEKTK